MLSLLVVGLSSFFFARGDRYWGGQEGRGALIADVRRVCEAQQHEAYEGYVQQMAVGQLTRRQLGAAREVACWREVTAQERALDEGPECAQAERRLQTATVSSLRLDAVLAAMLRCSRGMAAELVAAGRVEINHLPVSSAHAPVYESDVFTVRGKGRFRLTALPGKSKKDRQIIEFFQY